MTETEDPQSAPTCPRCGALLDGADAGHGSVAGGPVVCPACLLIGAAERPPGTDGVEVAGPSIEALDAALDAYDVQILLGQGGAGTVYRARHRKLDRLVAIKVLRPAPTLDAGERAAFAERFEREARMLAKLDHAHIVRIYDYGQSHDPTPGAPPFFYLVLEYVEGASLRDLLAAGRLTAREVLEFVPQVCDALQAAHDMGIVHRDIKPENILVDGNGRVRIADFGLAKLQGAEPTAYGLTRTNQVMGTLHYMAPEQMRASGAVDHRADLFSLGVVLYEMLTGELPIGRFAPPSASAENAKRFDDVVLRALENDPTARYQAASELRQDVQEPRGSSGQRLAAVASTSTRQKRRNARRRSRATTLPGATVRPSTTERVSATSPSLSVEPGGSAGLTRSWVALILLVFAYSQTWIWINGHGVTLSGPNGGGFVGETSFLAGFGGMGIKGFDGYAKLGIFEAKWYLGLVAYAIAVCARVLRWRGLEISEALPWLLTAFGFVLTGYTLSFTALSPDAELRGGLVVAFMVFLISSILDVAAFMHRGERRSRQREIARELAK